MYQKYYYRLLVIVVLWNKSGCSFLSLPFRILQHESPNTQYLQRLSGKEYHTTISDNKAAAYEAKPKAPEENDNDIVSSNRMSPKDLREHWRKQVAGGKTAVELFDVSKMKYLLDHDNHQMRDDFRNFLKTPLFQPRYDLTLEEEREVALQRLQAVCDGGFIRYYLSIAMYPFD